MPEKGIIRLDEFYTVEYDNTSWDLIYFKEGPETNDKGGLIKTRRASFHASLGAALRFYLNSSLKGSETIADVLNRIVEAENKMQTLADQMEGNL